MLLNDNANLQAQIESAQEWGFSEKQEYQRLREQVERWRLSGGLPPRPRSPHESEAGGFRISGAASNSSVGAQSNADQSIGAWPLDPRMNLGSFVGERPLNIPTVEAPSASAVQEGLRR